MDDPVRKLVGWAAIAAPLIHSATDIAELAGGGFSDAQLWLNYAAFLPIPAIMVGLYAAQRPRIGIGGLLGALVYGFAFIYFAHTTLTALEADIPDYALLLAQQGAIYTLNGGAMVIGGLLFGFATLRAKIIPAWTAWLFIAGLALNLAVAVLPIPSIFQVAGSFARNAGLIGMGWAVVRGMRSDKVTKENA
ncbi:MAG: hypothetical protein AB7Q37_05645 [Pyrinomonadaceae bacterium]